MSTTARRERLRQQGYAFHSEFRIDGELIAEFYTKEGGFFHWFPEQHPQDVEGSQWKKNAAMNEYKRLCEQAQEDRAVTVEKRRSVNVRQLVRGYSWNKDVVGFRYYQRPRVAVRREALTEHFDKAMEHIEDLLETNEHPERLRIFAETGPFVFFGEPGNGGWLEAEYGVCHE